MPRAKTSVSQEDYLKAIWESEQEGHLPISARLAEELGVTPPAVTAALKRMTRDGYLRLQRDGRIHLSAKGRAVAKHLVLRHHLAEKLLTDVIGLEWTRAHEEAERLEHGISPKVAELLLNRFGPHSRCPHGVPLFGGMRALAKRHAAKRLSEAEPDRSYEIVCVYEKDPQFLEFLAKLNLRPSVRIRVHRREYDQTMSLAVVSGRRPAAQPLYLGQPATQRIWVRPLS